MDRNSKTALSLLILGAVVPAVCVLWFMAQAMRNERLAVEQRLTAVYTNQLASAQHRVDGFWRERFEMINLTADETPPGRFARIVRAGLADSVIVLGEEGNPTYPSQITLAVAENTPDPETWLRAKVLEYRERDFAAAATVYQKIAEHETEPNLKARALLTQANNVLKTGDRDSALSLLASLCDDVSLAAAVGSQGALIVPNAQLRLLKLMDAPDERYRATFDHLAGRLNDYNDTLLSASQKRFLMEEMVDLHAVSSTSFGSETKGERSEVKSVTAASLFPTLEAERLAAEYLETARSAPGEHLASIPEMPGVWHARIPGGQLIALFHGETIRAALGSALGASFTPADATIELLPPGQTRSQRNRIPPAPAGEMLPGWRLADVFPGVDPFAEAYRRQMRTYFWIGIFVIGTLLTLTFVVARFLTAQMRLARLKSNLVSTVSHELKTPLASMRALVETLLAGRVRGEPQAREYLELVAKENQRLSHLIENFLTFSRLERGQHKFRFEPVAPAVLVENAMSAMKERLSNGACEFRQEVAPDLPDVNADADAIATVLINLLDNAFKYTEKDKRLDLRAYADSSDVCFEVQDNGIGLNSTEVSRIFDQFYQVDQSLTRQRGGCGLGLSIVRYIVQAHGGRVEVQCQPERGSMFRVRLPQANRSANP